MSGLGSIPHSWQHPGASLLLACLIAAAVIAELKLRRPRLVNGFYVLTSMWVARIVALLGTVGFAWVFAFLISSGASSLVYAMSGAVLIFNVGLLGVTWYNRITYSASDLSHFSIMTPGRPFATQLTAIHWISIGPNKIIVETSDGRRRVIVNCFIAFKHFAAFLRAHCPGAVVEECP